MLKWRKVRKMMPGNWPSPSSECLGTMISDVETLDMVSRMRKDAEVHGCSGFSTSRFSLKTPVVFGPITSDIQKVSVHQDAHKTPFIKEQHKVGNDCPMTNQ